MMSSNRSCKLRPSSPWGNWSTCGVAYLCCQRSVLLGVGHPLPRILGLHQFYPSVCHRHAPETNSNRPAFGGRRVVFLYRKNDHALVVFSSLFSSKIVSFTHYQWKERSPLATSRLVGRPHLNRDFRASLLPVPPGNIVFFALRAQL